MKVKFLTNVSIRQGEYKAGDVADIEEEDRAGQLIKDGLALAAADPEPEAAMLRDAPERATHPSARARGV